MTYYRSHLPPFHAYYAAQRLAGLVRRVRLLLQLVAEHGDDRLLAEMAHVPSLQGWVLRLFRARSRPPTPEILAPLLASTRLRVRREAQCLTSRLPE
jgi:hypothetical protein